jgi:hypothetical protein
MTDDVIQTHGLDITDRDSEDYRKLSREILKAHVQVLEVEKRRTLGDYGSSQEVALRESIDPKPYQDGKQGHTSVSQQQQQTSATVKQAGDDFWNEFNQDWKPRSRTDYKNAIDQIVAGLGPDTQLHTIDYNRAKEFREGLRDGSLSKHGKPLSVSRVNFFLAVVKRIFDLAMKQDKNLDRSCSFNCRFSSCNSNNFCRISNKLSCASPSFFNASRTLVRDSASIFVSSRKEKASLAYFKPDNVDAPRVTIYLLTFCGRILIRLAKLFQTT